MVRDFASAFSLGKKLGERLSQQHSAPGMLQGRGSISAPLPQGSGGSPSVSWCFCADPPWLLPQLQALSAQVLHGFCLFPLCCKRWQHSEVPGQHRFGFWGTAWVGDAAVLYCCRLCPVVWLCKHCRQPHVSAGATWKEWRFHINDTFRFWSALRVMNAEPEAVVFRAGWALKAWTAGASNWERLWNISVCFLSAPRCCRFLQTQKEPVWVTPLGLCRLTRKQPLPSNSWNKAAGRNAAFLTWACRYLVARKAAMKYWGKTGVDPITVTPAPFFSICLLNITLWFSFPFVHLMIISIITQACSVTPLSLSAYSHLKLLCQLMLSLVINSLRLRLFDVFPLLLSPWAGG